MRPFEAISGNGLFSLLKTCVYIGAKYGNLDDDQLRGMIPSSHTVSRGVSLYANSAKHGLYEKVRSIASVFGLAVTTNLWMDNFKRLSYLVLTVHFIDRSRDMQVSELRDQILFLLPLEPEKSKG